MRFPSSLASLLLLAGGGFVTAQKPQSTVTRFAHLPSKIYYFDDTSSVIYHDPLSQNIHRSGDEGKEWKLVDGIPEGEAAQLVEHPTDNQVAFVLTRSKTHYATYNQGVTWQKFDVPAEASLGGPPMSFHATEKGWILYQGTICEDTGTGRWGSGKSCWDETYATKDAFRTPSFLLLSQTNQCLFAHGSKDFVSPSPSETSSLIFCIAFDQSTKAGDAHSLLESRLYSSKDWFEKDNTVVDLGIGKRARGLVGLGVVSKFVVAALKADLVEGGGGSGGAGGDPMHLYVTVDGKEWNLAKFPHSSIPSLKENAYTIVESTTHSMAIDVLIHPTSSIGDLFVSNSKGTEFVISLQDTNRNSRGIVDFENLVGLDGIGVANQVANREEVVGWGKEKQIRSVITYDDGRTWNRIKAPAKKTNGDSYSCDVNSEGCSLHLHSVSTPHNYGKVFSSTAPGFVMGVGSVGAYLLPYEDCDTFVSTDAGVTWSMAFEDASKYEFGDQGSILVAVNDEEPTDFVSYSRNAGKTWLKYNFGTKIRALLLTTIPDSTSQKFILLGSTSRKDAGSQDRHAVVFLDFATMLTRQCGKNDFEKWYARPEGRQCLMGHKQWYQRKKADAECYVGNKFTDPVGQEENCPCDDIDFECDFNYVLQDGECVPNGPEPVPAGTCDKNSDKYMGSSGYRLIPGNTCDKSRGKAKDVGVMKDCSKGELESSIRELRSFHDFATTVVQHVYFGDSQTILVQLSDNTIWQSSNEGFTWKQLYPAEMFLALAIHTFSKDRAYLITANRKVYYTTDTGKQWYNFNPPTDPNGLGIPIIDFHPSKPDWLIWTGQVDCTPGTNPKCHSVSSYTTDNGRKWKQFETYVKTCSWARDRRLKTDERMILCETFKKKEGSQREKGYNPMELVAGGGYYTKKEKLFESVVGFATFSEYLIVAELNEQKGTLNLQVSLDGLHFAEGQFPPGMSIENKAYTILESSTDSVFLHVTTSAKDGDEYGSLFKSNSNGTYYSLSIENANRNKRGYVDFEKMIGLDGIAVLNVVSNPEEAAVNGRKKLQTMITHNDGGSWKPMTPPAKDSLGQPYACTSTSCALHIHGYTERRDPKATFSSPSAVGLMMAVGNVGEELAAYTDSDTFLTRDAGFTWEEVHKDAHLWEFGDYGSILVIANDEDATDHVLYTTDEGLNWKEYNFGERIFVRSIQTVPSDTSRKFLLFGTRPQKPEATVSIHLDFSALTSKKCEQKLSDPNHDDFELWSPSQSRDETCLFGRQVKYHRRIRDRDCYVGESIKREDLIVRNCQCGPSDFECEFNYHRDAAGNCVLFPTASALSPLSTEEEQCPTSTDGFWYERTNVRRIPFSSCAGGNRPDRGKQHTCPGTYQGAEKSSLFWWTVFLAPFAFAGLGGLWWVKKGSMGGGSIRLGEQRPFGGPDSGPFEVLASIPYFLIGAAGAGIAWAQEKWEGFSGSGRRGGYRTVQVDDDAEILRGAYEDD
ncbi:hypothetical protein BDY24DRAFT_337902 [Mrakia frigida]|uniref:vacuolar protein sorting/targeting protein 10 n=1 Tax=Mrakia frigida TaxID=29902 RepID=UPI003FCC0F00